MFPTLDSVIIAEVLAHHGNDVERAALSLLDLSSETASDAAGEERGRFQDVDLDAQLALATQAELDAESARALHQAMADSERQSATVNGRAQGTTAQSNASATAGAVVKNLVSRVRSAGRRAPREATVGLLDAAADSAVDPVAMEPITAELVPPQTEPYAAPTYAPPIATRSPATLEASTAVDTTDRYGSRVDRARAANAARRTPATGCDPTPPMTEQPMLVPVD